MNSQVVKTQIRGIGHYLPPRVVTNEGLSKCMDTSDEWISERSGIKERRYVDEKTSTSDLAVHAAQQALTDANLKTDDIDFIVAATLSPDLYFPGIGTILQDKLGMKPLPALDVRAQCSGFVYGLATADAFIRSGQAQRILFVCAEAQSKLLDLTTRGREVAVLFGDGAGALVLEAATTSVLPSTKNKERGIIDTLMGCDGSGANILCLRNPGTTGPKFIRESDLAEGTQYPYMEGRTVFKNAVTRMVDCVQTMLRKHEIEVKDINLLVPHQANLRINEMVREKLGLSENRVFNNIQKYGNTTAATIPLCLSEARDQGKLKQGDLVLTVAFGAGFTWGCNLLRW